VAFSVGSLSLLTARHRRLDLLYRHFKAQSTHQVTSDEVLQLRVDMEWIVI